MTKGIYKVENDSEKNQCKFWKDCLVQSSNTTDKNNNNIMWKDLANSEINTTTDLWNTKISTRPATSNNRLCGSKNSCKGGVFLY